MDLTSAFVVCGFHIRKKCLLLQKRSMWNVSCARILAFQVVTADGEEFLASMPLKFRKHVWIKRGDFVVTEPIPEGNKVRAEIVRILMKDQIHYIMQNNKWPSGFVEHSDEEKESAILDSLERFKMTKASESDTESDDDLLMENTNRQMVYVEESDSGDSDDDENLNDDIK
nr:probable RNA-binding protein EIF1AD isoform X5 [Cherax quadricarinatus]